MQPQQLTPQQALSILSQAAAAAYWQGAITFADHRAAVIATEVLANALAKPQPETTTSGTDSPGECGGDADVPDGRKRRKKSGQLTTD